ncbi:MAG TPA: hypothetical protein VF266_09285 [Thermoanaerobaculia bacterium]
MKRALPFILIPVASVALLFATIAFGVSSAWKRAGRAPWPMDLGTLEELPKQFPKRESGAAALRLAELAEPLVMEDEADDPMRPFFYVEHERGEVVVGATPPQSAAFLATHEARLDEIRAHVLGGGDFGWAVDLGAGARKPMPGLLMYDSIVAPLVARALIRGDWEDLHAAYLLVRGLESWPELIVQETVVSLHRTINAAVWKMPLPAPEWVAEQQRTDHRRLFLRGLQTEAWQTWMRADRVRVPVLRQLFLMSAGNLALHQQRTAMALANVTSCGFDATRFFEERMRKVPEWNTVGLTLLSNYGATWARVRKLDLEREATANALRIRAGQPIDPRSRCSDGTWRFEKGTLSYTAELPRVTDTEMPLTLVLSPR